MNVGVTVAVRVAVGGGVSVREGVGDTASAVWDAAEFAVSAMAVTSAFGSVVAIGAGAVAGRHARTSTVRMPGRSRLSRELSLFIGERY